MITGIRHPRQRHVDETVDNHYRQLYQIRRAHGDVISRVGMLFTVVGMCIMLQFSICNVYLDYQITVLYLVTGLPFIAI